MRVGAKRQLAKPIYDRELTFQPLLTLGQEAQLLVFALICLVFIIVSSEAPTTGSPLA